MKSVSRSGIIMMVASATLTAASANGLDSIPATAVPSHTTVLASAAASQGGFSGKVTEAISTAGYVYVQIDTGSETIWAAAPEQDVRVGDSVTIERGSPMPNHVSKTLDRTFDLVYFVGGISVQNADGRSAAPTGHPPIASSPQSISVDLSGISKANDGKTVGEVFDEKSSLANQEVSLRGKVVKFNPRIMGKNWIHLQDGTVSQAGANDLVLTTSSVVAVGDTILVRGILSVDRDFGFGYEYDAMIEDATVTVE